MKKHAFSLAESLYVRAVADTRGEKQASRLHESNENFMLGCGVGQAIAHADYVAVREQKCRSRDLPTEAA